MAAMTRSELIREVEAALRHTENPDDAFTAQEWCAMLGLTSQHVMRRLHALKDAGRLQVVQVVRERLDGEMVTKPAYRVLTNGG